MNTSVQLTGEMSFNNVKRFKENSKVLIKQRNTLPNFIAITKKAKLMDS